MKVIPMQQKMSEEEYFMYEEKSELKHELVEGNLYEMSGVSIFHNNIVLRLSMLLYAKLNGTEWQVTLENFKIKNPAGNFFYPDIAVCSPEISRYYSTAPILIIEVLSEATRKYDLTDKFIQYSRIDSLQYYLCVEPEQQVVIFYFRTESGEWQTETFTKDEQLIALPKLNVSFAVKDIYKA
jgi:Uma2 family endonuclease